jgi:hypothetical protein
MKVSKKEIAKARQKEMRTSDGHVANNLEREGWVKDRKTGEFYNPQERFDTIMNKPEITAMLNRLKIR